MLKRAIAFALAAVLACSLSFPQLAFAVVMLDETELAQGENAVGGGTATLDESTLAMVDVTADVLYTDQDLSVNFNGGNEIKNVNVADSAEVDLNFSGENNVEEVRALDSSDVTINANGHNEFEEIGAYGESNLTINVTGENEFEEIVGVDDANITIRGTDCQKKDVVKLGEGEKDTYLATGRGLLDIDHVTVELLGKETWVGSEEGNVRINTSKLVKGDGNDYTEVFAGGSMQMRESVIDIAGVVHSDGKMTIDHSDVKVKPATSQYAGESPFRVHSKTGIELINEKNGSVKKGKLGDDTIYYLDTDDNDGADVDLKADGKPAYYTCDDCTSGNPHKSDSAKQRTSAALVRAWPGTGDNTSPLWPMGVCLLGAATATFALTRREG